jgi:hypothetical protein
MIPTRLRHLRIKSDTYRHGGQNEIACWKRIRVVHYAAAQHRRISFCSENGSATCPWDYCARLSLTIVPMGATSGHSPTRSFDAATKPVTKLPRMKGAALLEKLQQVAADPLGQYPWAKRSTGRGGDPRVGQTSRGRLRRSKMPRTRCCCVTQRPVREIGKQAACADSNALL